MYWQGRRDYRDAASQFEKVIQLTNGGDLTAQGINRLARENLASVVKDAAAAGITIKPSIPATPNAGSVHGSNPVTTTN